MENTKKKQRRPARGVTAGGAIFALESEVALAGDPAVPVAYTPHPIRHTPGETLAGNVFFPGVTGFLRRF